MTTTTIQISTAHLSILQKLVDKEIEHARTIQADRWVTRDTGYSPVDISLAVFELQELRKVVTP